MAKNYSEENLVPVNKEDIKPGQLVIRIGEDYFVGLAGESPTPPTPGGMDDLEFFDWMTILNNN